MTMGTLREKVAFVINDGLDQDLYDRTIMGLIVLSLISVALESFHLPLGVHNALNILEWVTTGVFTVDYLMRLWTARLKFAGVRHPVVSYVRSPLAVIDLLSVLPLYLTLLFPSVAFLSYTRIIRALKLIRYSKSLVLILKVVKAERTALMATVMLILGLIFVFGTLTFLAEHEVQADKFTDIPTSMWWAVVTITTVGYGDLFPVTALGRFCGGALGLLGIFIVAIPVGILAGGFLNEYKAEDEEKKNHRRRFHKRHRPLRGH